MPRLLVLTYHGIVDVIKCERLERNFHKFSEFIEQMEYLKSNKYNFLRYQDLYTFFNERSKLKGKNVLITFDDGYLNNALILDYCEVNNIPILVFYSSLDSYKDYPQTIWTVELSLLLLHGRLKDGAKVFKNNVVYDFSLFSERNKYFNLIRYELKNKDLLYRETVINNLKILFLDNELEYLLNRFNSLQIMKIKDVQFFIQKYKCLSIGLHGKFHEIHNVNQSFSTLYGDIVCNINDLCEVQFSNDLLAYAFPNGNFNNNSEDVLLKASIDMAFILSNRDVNLKSDSILKIPRYTAPRKLRSFKKIVDSSFLNKLKNMLHVC